MELPTPAEYAVSVANRQRQKAQAQVQQALVVIKHALGIGSRQIELPPFPIYFADDVAVDLLREELKKFGWQIEWFTDTIEGSECTLYENDYVELRPL